MIYRDDNLSRLTMLPAECIDLIYLDPPFFSNRHYEVIWGDEAEVRSFEDRWSGGIQVYIDWMRQRLIELHRVLKPGGSIYLHCDPHASHYLKVMMDDIFGTAGFLGEVIWRRTAAHVSSRRWPRIHDVLLSYAKDPSLVYFSAPKVAADEGWVQREYRFRDERGVYMIDNLTGAGTTAGPSGQPWRGVDPKNIGAGRHWRYIPETLERLDQEGRIHWPRRGQYPKLKQYLSESGGKAVGDVWTDIPVIGRTAAERLGYPTQKPEALLKRVIEASSRKGDIVLDPFCGCGTTIAAAQMLGRRWVGIDISPTACNLMKRRLLKAGAATVEVKGMPTTEEHLAALKPFEFQNWIIDCLNGVQANRRSGDMGIDGWTFFLHDPVQIKQSTAVGRNVVDNFETAIDRAGKKSGAIVAFSFGRGAREEVARVRQNGVNIHLLTVKDLVERLDWVMKQLGITDGRPDLRIAPLPTFDPSRHSTEELIASAQAG